MELSFFWLASVVEKDDIYALGVTAFCIKRGIENFLGENLVLSKPNKIVRAFLNKNNPFFLFLSAIQYKKESPQQPHPQKKQLRLKQLHRSAHSNSTITTSYNSHTLALKKSSLKKCDFFLLSGTKRDTIL